MSVALRFTVAVAILSSLSAPGGAVLVLMLALAPPGIILDKMSFNGSLQREWLLLHQVAERPRCADQVVAVLEVDEVFSLDDLRRLEGHPRFDSCGLSADNGKLPDLRGLCFGTDSLVSDGSNRGSDSTSEDLLLPAEDPVGFRSGMVDRLDGPYSGSERSEDEQFDSSVEQVRSSDPPFSRSALRLCPIGGTSQAAPVPRGLAWLMSAWPAIVERWLLLGPRRQGEDYPRCSLAWAPLPPPSFGCERCAVVCGDVCVPGFGCGLARECVRLPPVERVAAASGSQGAASESAAGSGRLRGCGR